MHVGFTTTILIAMVTATIPMVVVKLALNKGGEVTQREIAFLC